MNKIKQFWIFFGVIILFNLIIFLTKWGGEHFLQYVSDFLPILCSLFASVILFQTFIRFKEFDRAKVAWMMIFLGIFLDFIAETTYAILEIFYKVNMNEVFPTLADYFWCFAYLPLVSGLIIMFIGYWKSGFPMGKVKLYGLISFLLLIVLSVVFYFILLPIMQDSETDTIAKIFYLYYPIGDLIIIIPAVTLFYITNLFSGGTISQPWKYLTISFICFTVADLLYSYLSWIDAYGNGNLIDIAWNAGYLLIGLSGLYQIKLMNSIEGK